jgi:hypothetical protein
MVLKPINAYSVQEVAMWLTAQGLGEYTSTFLSAGVNGDVLVSLEVEDLKNDFYLSDEHAKQILSNIEFMLDMVMDSSDAAASTTSRGGAGGGGVDVNGLENERRLANQIRELQNEVQSKDEQIAYLTNQLTESRSKDFSLQNHQMPPQSVVAYAEPVQYQHQYPQQQHQPYIPQQQVPASQQPYNTNPNMYNQQSGLPPQQQQHYPQPVVSHDQYGNPVYTQQQQQQQQQYHPTPTTTSAPPPKPSKAGLAVTGAAKGAAGGAIRGAIVGAILPGMTAADGAKANAAVGALTGGVGGLRGRRNHIL